MSLGDEIDPTGRAVQFGGAVDTTVNLTRHSPPFVPDSRRAWIQLGFALLIAAIGAVGMWAAIRASIPRY